MEGKEVDDYINEIAKKCHLTAKVNEYHGYQEEDGLTSASLD